MTEGTRYAARVSYVGTRYCGWQMQKEASGDLPSIQATIRDALGRITGEEVSVVGSGRTDSGVHAVGQVAHFTVKRRPWSPAVLQNGLNSLLPPDVRVLALVPVPMEFHSQRSALKKQYSYYFQQGPCALPHLMPYSWWIRKRLNQMALRKAVSALVGEHDFKPFQASGSRPGPTRRRILEAEVSWESVSFPGGAGQELGLIRIRLVGTGFLKQMVRGIAGTLLQVGEERRDAGCFEEILSQGDRKLVGPTAPGRALWLERVWYPRDLLGDAAAQFGEF